MCQGAVIKRPPLTESVRRAELQRLQHLLRGGGHSATERRMAIYDILLQVNDHICVEHILEAIRQEHPAWSVNKTTVYRTLELLQELELVYVMHHTDGRAQYELALHGKHGHLFCSVCGRVQDIDTGLADTLQQGLLARQGFAVDLLNNALMGVCEHCASHGRG